MEVILGILLVALIIYLAIMAIILLFVCLGVGLIVGIFPAIFNAIKGYCVAVAEEITNPFLKVVLYIFVGLTVLCIVAPIVIFIIGIISAIAG
jgi:hypothetical protein